MGRLRRGGCEAREVRWYGGKEFLKGELKENGSEGDLLCRGCVALMRMIVLIWQKSLSRKSCM